MFGFSTNTSLTMLLYGVDVWVVASLGQFGKTLTMSKRILISFLQVKIETKYNHLLFEIGSLPN